MADKSIQEKQRRRQKAVKDPVCASRVIKNQLYGSGWSGKLSTEEKNLATSLLDDAGAMYSLQITRDREVGPLSLHNAIFWEHHQLSDQTIVSTPALVWEQQQQLNEQTITTGIIHAVPFFSANEELWKESLQQVSSKQSSDFVEIHHFFSNIRDREFTIWPVLVEGYWVTIIMRVAKMEPAIYGSLAHCYYDRKVSQFAIVDPVDDEDSASRLQLVFKRLRSLLRMGCIELSGEDLVETLITDEVEEEWESGLMSYAISREFLRRLKVLIHRRGREDSGEPDLNSENQLLWSPFEESPNIDGYREALLSACSNYVIETSGYRIRNALEVPSSTAGHFPERLLPERPGSDGVVVDEKINIGDQTRRFNVEMRLPEDYPREVSIESGPEISEESEADDSEKDDDDDDTDDSMDSDEEDQGTVVVTNRAKDILPQEVTAPNTPPKSVEPNTEGQGPPPSDAPSPQDDPAAELRESLQNIAAAAQSLTEDVQVSKQIVEDAVMSDVPEERPGTPPTQQEVDSDDDDQALIENTPYSENVTTHPAKHPVPELPLPKSQVSSSPAVKEEKSAKTPDFPEVQQAPEIDGPEAQELEIKAPATTPQAQTQESVTKVPEATMEEPNQSEEAHAPNSVPEAQDASTTATATAPEPTVDDISTGKGIVVDSDNDEVKQESVTTERQQTIVPSIETAAPLPDEDLRKEVEEYESIFGNSEEASSAVAADESDSFIPEEEEDEQPPRTEFGINLAEEDVGVPFMPSVVITREEKSGGEAVAVEPQQEQQQQQQQQQNAAEPRQSSAPSSSSVVSPLPPRPSVLPATAPASLPAPASAPKSVPTPNFASVPGNSTAIPGLGLSANTFSRSPVGKRGREEGGGEDEDGNRDGEEMGERSPKRQKAEPMADGKKIE